MKWLNRIFVFPIRLYQRFISPLLGNNCRYQPTCSHYMVECIYEWGPIIGIYYGVKRIFRCHPWGGMGPDPIPKRQK